MTHRYACDLLSLRIIDTDKCTPNCRWVNDRFFVFYMLSILTGIMFSIMNRHKSFSSELYIQLCVLIVVSSFS